MPTPLEDVTTLLAQIETPGSFATHDTAAPDDLRLSVAGVGRVHLPVTDAQARDLIAVARPARHGFKAETRLDTRVRDTWEVPKSRIAIDRRAWERTLGPRLETIRRELGLPEQCRLKAELHNLLIYEPGQFFAAHQDSEKSDGMIGSLVVILPSGFAGGEMVIEHHDEQVIVRGSRRRLTLAAFYADCHHQVRAVTRGYRIALTWNLVLTGRALATVSTPAGQIDRLAQHVQRVFETRPARRWANDTDREPPDRLVYGARNGSEPGLLLSWSASVDGEASPSRLRLGLRKVRTAASGDVAVFVTSRCIVGEFAPDEAGTPFAPGTATHSSRTREKGRCASHCEAPERASAC